MQIVYLIIAITAWYYPNAANATSNGSSPVVAATTEATAAAIALAKRMIAEGLVF